MDSYELCVFAGAWLTHDPNEPGYTPLDPEIERTAWSNARRCNFNGGYYIDYGDFAVFGQNWLWRTCWKQSPLDFFENMMEIMAMGGGEGMLAMSVEMSSVSISLTESEPKPEEAELSTTELASLAKGIYAIIEYIDTAIEEDYENAENLYELKDFLKGVLQDLQTGL